MSLKGSTALAAGDRVRFADPAAAPEPTAVTPALIEAAKKEGKVVWYTSVDLPLAEKVAKAFEAKYPGIAVRVERTGAERVFQRIGQEYSSRIHAVDVVNSSDAAHFIVWKRDGILAPYVPEDVAKHYPAEHKDPDGMFASFRVWLSVIAYNTSLVKAEEAPKSFADLLDPKWAGKIVKAHPGYSGTIMTATFQMSRDLGWEYFEKLAKQKIMQVQSSSDPPKKLALGERAVQADGNEYNVFQIKEKGGPVEPVYATEGSPLIIGPNGIFKDGAQSQCRAPVPELLLLARVPAAHHRRRRAALGPSAGQGEGGPQAVQGDQDHEGRRRRGREDGRGDQGALHQDLQGVARDMLEGESSGAVDPPWIASLSLASDGCFVSVIARRRSRREQSSSEHEPMSNIRFTRRTILKGLGRRSASPSLPRPCARLCRRREAITPALIDAGDARRARSPSTPRWTCRSPRSSAKAFEAKYRRHRRARRALRRRARLHPHRPGVRRATSTPSTSCNTADAVALASSGSATAGSRPTCRRRSRSTTTSDFHDPDGTRRDDAHLVSSIGYNTNLVKTEDAPKSFADLLDPKWNGKIVKAHPAYSGTIMNATFQIARDLGWDYLEKLAQAEGHAGAVGDRYAQEDRARRARHHGRRRRLL